MRCASAEGRKLAVVARDLSAAARHQLRATGRDMASWAARRQRPPWPGRSGSPDLSRIVVAD